MRPRVRWEAPPPKRRGRNAEAYALAKHIASRPNQWARIAAYRTHSTAAKRAHSIRTGKIQAWSDVGTFEAKVRQTDTTEFSLYVRCIYVKKGGLDDGDE